MKKFLIALCILVMLLPTFCFAAPSPTVKSKITSFPELMFVFAEKTDEWKDILPRLKTIDTINYILLEALKVDIDKPYQKVEWTLSKPITSEDEPFILIIDSEAIVKQEISTTSDGNVITDFTDLETGIYYILFYIRKGA